MRLTLRHVAVWALMAAAPLPAQHVVGARPGLCSFVRGDVSINGDRLDGDGFPNRFVEPGQSLSTDIGMAEVQLGWLSVVRAGGRSKLRLAPSDLDAVVLELLQGSAVVDLRDRFSRQTVTVLVGEARVDLEQVGVYRFDSRPGRTPRLKVFDGKATVSAGLRQGAIGEGRALTLAQDSWQIKPFDKRRGDRLDKWATERRKLFQRQAPGKKRKTRRGSVIFP